MGNLFRRGMVVAAVALVVTDAVEAELPAWVALAALAALGCYFAAARALRRPLSTWAFGIPALFGLGMLLTVVTGDWDCYPECGAGRDALSAALMVIAIAFASVLVVGLAVVLARVARRR